VRRRVENACGAAKSDLPADLERIIDKALEFDPRHPHASSLLALTGKRRFQPLYPSRRYTDG
jgi:hypothetical protein